MICGSKFKLDLLILLLSRFVLGDVLHVDEITHLVVEQDVEHFNVDSQGPSVFVKIGG